MAIFAPSESPAVIVKEVDLTGGVPNVQSTTGAFIGDFRWGPVDKPILVSSETELVAKYGKPSNINAETWFTAASYLAYSDSLYVSRAHQSAGNSHIGSGSITVDDTSLTFLGNSETGITAGDAIFGEGIDDGATVVSVSIVGSDTQIVMNKAAVATPQGGTASIQVFDKNLSFNAVANSAAVPLINNIVKNEDDYNEDEGGF